MRLFIYKIRLGYKKFIKDVIVGTWDKPLKETLSDRLDLALSELPKNRLEDTSKEAIEENFRSLISKFIEQNKNVFIVDAVEEANVPEVAFYNSFHGHVNQIKQTVRYMGIASLDISM